MAAGAQQARRTSVGVLYLYCIADAEEPVEPGTLGLGLAHDGGVFSVQHGGLAGVVSRALPARCRPTRENLLAHELVNEAVMRRHAMVPMSFGTVFESERDVVALLEGAERPLRELLALLRGKIELGVKVRWDRPRVLAELEREEPELRDLRGPSEGPGGAGRSRTRYGRAVERALESRARELKGSVYQALRPLAVAGRTRRAVGNDLLLDVAFLVENAREEDFDRAVDALVARHRGELRFDYTGPWPPYSFVNVRLQLERVRD